MPRSSCGYGAGGRVPHVAVMDLTTVSTKRVARPLRTSMGDSIMVQDSQANIAAFVNDAGKWMYQTRWSGSNLATVC